MSNKKNAKNVNVNKKPAPKAKVNGSVFFSRIVLFVLLIPMSIVIFPTLFFLFFGMLPTIAAFILERSKHQYKWLCIGGFNIAGSFYYLLRMWYGSHTFDEALSILFEVTALIVMYGSACFGLLVYMMFPVAVSAISQLIAYKKINHLKTIQQRLIEQWGDEVKTTE